jgi:2-polyprenyl-6-methoxyphenol hydroxylase-like FAD-dependent oxidoreductase
VNQQSGENVEITVEYGGEQTQMSATYLVAADGGRSTIRRLLNISFEGFTFPEQLVSTNVYYPFDKYGWEDGNFCIDPEHWALIARINDKGLWRVSYGEVDGLPNEKLMERMPWKFSELFPGPKPPQYKLDQSSPYRLNQRCADRFREGRILLAGDAAHLCNPFGGLGLSGGILDAAAVADALIGLHEGKASDAILDKYAEVRRRIFLETVDPQSRSNKLRMHDKDPPTIGDRDPFLKMLRDATPEQKQQIRGHANLAVDMSEFFDAPRGDGAREETMAR